MLQPADIRVNRASIGLASTASIDSRTLTIAWSLQCTDEAGSCTAVQQTAYQITVRDETAGIVAFDSRLVSANHTSHSGTFPTLRSARRYALLLRVCSLPMDIKLTDSCTTSGGKFHTALLEGDEWRGAWLGGFTQLRGEFPLTQPRLAVVTALAHAAGVGCFALTVNGRRADAIERNASFMNPGWANVPTVRTLYRQFDISALLLDGINVLGIRLGQCKFGYQDSFCEGAHGALATCRAFSLDLRLRYRDGREQLVKTHARLPPTLASDASSWLGTTVLNPIRYTHLYHGEIVDGRIGDLSWDTPSYRPPMGADAWQPASPYANASRLATAFTLLGAPPMAATDTYVSRSVTRVRTAGGGTGSTAFVFDFGVNMAGFACLVLHEVVPAGTALTLKYGEVLHKNGTVSLPWGSGPGINQANQTDRYYARGQAGEVFTPAFTYHGYRYVQLEGLPESIVPVGTLPNTTLLTLTALLVRTAMAHTGAVRFGQSTLPNALGGAAGAERHEYEILNEIQAAIVATQQSNVHSHPTDCPQREKRGWTGDAQVTSGAASLNFDTEAMYAQWLQSMQDSSTLGCALAPDTPSFPQPQQFECCTPAHQAFGCDYTGLPPGGLGGGFNETRGSIADVVPYMAVGGWPGDPSWGIAGAIIPWEVYRQTGDPSLASEFWPLASGVVDFLTRQGNPATHGLVTFGYYGDWLSLEPVPKPQVTGWSHILSLSRVRDLADAIGKKDAAAHYAALLERLTQAYRSTYQGSDGSFGSSQSANLLALYLNLTGNATAAATATAVLVSNLARHANRTQSGLVGASYLLQALTATGQHGLALDIASAVDEPSWGYMVRQGPGTLWETWDATSNSRNHPMFSASIGKYLYALGGLQPDQWQHPAVPELRPAGGDAATAARLGSAAVSIVHRLGAGTITLSWACRERIASGPLMKSASTVVSKAPASFAAATQWEMEANVTIPHGFSTAFLSLPILAHLSQATGFASVTLVERRSGVRYVHNVDERQAEGSQRQLGETDELLRRVGVLALVVSADRAELTISNGKFDFALVAV